MAASLCFRFALGTLQPFRADRRSEGERLDRIPVVKGEIRLADRAYISAERIAAVIDAGDALAQGHEEAF